MQALRHVPVTVALLGASTVIYLLVHHLGQENIAYALFITKFVGGGLVEIRAGELWRLVTPIFLHFGIFHLVFNMLWTWELGRLVEIRHGAHSLLGLTAVLAVISNLSQYYTSGPGFGGMSGVVYGYFGYVWIQGQFNPTFGIRLNRSVVYLLLGWFALGWSGVFELFNLRIANVAHTAGLLSGIAVAFLCCALRHITSNEKTKW